MAPSRQQKNDNQLERETLESSTYVDSTVMWKPDPMTNRVRPVDSAVVQHGTKSEPACGKTARKQAAENGQRKLKSSLMILHKELWPRKGGSSSLDDILMGDSTAVPSSYSPTKKVAVIPLKSDDSNESPTKKPRDCNERSYANRKLRNIKRPNYSLDDETDKLLLDPPTAAPPRPAAAKQLPKAKPLPKAKQMLQTKQLPQAKQLQQTKPSKQTKRKTVFHESMLSSVTLEPSPGPDFIKARPVVTSAQPGSSSLHTARRRLSYPMKANKASKIKTDSVQDGVVGVESTVRKRKKTETSTKSGASKKKKTKVPATTTSVPPVSNEVALYTECGSCQGCKAVADCGSCMQCVRRPGVPPHVATHLLCVKRICSAPVCCKMRSRPDPPCSPSIVKREPEGTPIQTSPPSSPDPSGTPARRVETKPRPMKIRPDPPVRGV